MFDRSSQGFWSSSQNSATAALVKRLPTVYGYREHVLAGGLISYGVDLRWCFYRGAYFVDKILVELRRVTCRWSSRPRCS